MVLNYYKGVKNFGDALNPMIFNKLLSNSFSDDSDIDFYGIGSLLGNLDYHLYTRERKKVIFTTGHGEYGKLPKIDGRYDIVCVRGPLTAKALKIDNKLAVTDGAILLKQFNFKPLTKKYDYSYMPHHDSTYRFNWKSLCEEIGIHYIDPLDNPETILKEILETKVLFAEAMHGAIVADTLRVPWVPVKAYHYIREFKWLDWATSMNVAYNPNIITSIFNDKQFVTKYFNSLSKSILPSTINNFAANSFIKFQELTTFKKVEKEFSQLKNAPTYLSSPKVVEEKIDILLEKMDYIKMKYSNV